MLERLLAFLRDGTQFPGIFSLAGTMALTLFVLVQIVRSAVKQKPLGDLMGHQVLVPVMTVVLFAGLIGLDHLRSPGLV
jgi:nucleoside recognition membrane protein YjiH